MEAKHTPGPWMADSGTFAVVSSKGQIAECGDCLDMSVAECAANAALIAAAPDLLAALRGALLMLRMERTSHAESGDAKRRSYVEPIDGALATYGAVLARAEGRPA